MDKPRHAAETPHVSPTSPVESADPLEASTSLIDASLDEYCERLAVALKNLRRATLTAIGEGLPPAGSLDEYFDKLSIALARHGEPFLDADHEAWERVVPVPVPSEAAPIVDEPAYQQPLSPSPPRAALSPIERSENLATPPVKRSRAATRTSPNRKVTSAKGTGGSRTPSASGRKRPATVAPPRARTRGASRARTKRSRNR